MNHESVSLSGMESFDIQPLTWPQLLIFLQGVQSTFTYMESSYLALQNEAKEERGGAWNNEFNHGIPRFFSNS